MTRLSPLQRRPLLVQAAIRVIAAEGVAAASTRAIVAEAGMSLASFHYAFRSHDEMMRELISSVTAAESSAVFESLRPGADIRSSLRAGLHAFLDYVVSDPSHEQALQELAQYALRTPGLEAVARAQREGYRKAAIELLVQGAVSAGVRWTIPVDQVARLMVTITDGVTVAWLADRDTAAATRVLDFAADTIASLATPTGDTNAAH
jgi:AcrR family transcriptional regulator